MGRRVLSSVQFEQRERRESFALPLVNVSLEESLLIRYRLHPEATIFFLFCLQYAVGRELQEGGVVSAGDMTTAACSTKMAYLLGRLEDPELVARGMTSNIRGEMTPEGEGGGVKYFGKDLILSNL